MDELDRKVASLFSGKVVKKDLLLSRKKQLNIPAYVLEYLLGMYCSSPDEEVVNQGLKEVEKTLTESYVHPDEAEILKSKVEQYGKYRVIDKVKVKLYETEDKYWASLENLKVDHVNIAEEIIQRYERLLGGGLWGIVDLRYDREITYKHVKRPFVIDRFRPIQVETTALEDLRIKRSQFSKDEWIDLMLRSMGLEPEKLTYRLKLLNLCRLIPFVEHNYNLVELGPRETGKSYVYRELSPYSILISGGETTVAGLFIDMRGKRKGLVMLWDVVAFDEVAGLRKLTDEQAVQILKDYMESGSFSRGNEEYPGNASLVFVGNIDYDIPELLSKAHLFVPFPMEMQDPAFLDRFHAYLPGWEFPKMKSDMFTQHYGFVTDYLSWIMKELRKISFTDAIEKYFKLGNSVGKRDSDAIHKTISGMIKLIHPDGNYTKEDVEEYLILAIELRRRIKEQLKKMRSSEFWNTDLSYIDIETSKEIIVPVPEQPEQFKLPEKLEPGEVLGLAKVEPYGFGTIQKYEIIANKGKGKLKALGSVRRVMKESIETAYEYISSNYKILGIDIDIKSDYDITVNAPALAVQKEGPSAGLTILIGMVSALTQKAVRHDVAMTGEVTVLGNVLPVGAIQEKIVAAAEAGIKTVYIPAENEKDYLALPESIRNRLEVRLVSKVEEVLNEVLIDYKVTTEERLDEKDRDPHILLNELETVLRKCIKTNLERVSTNWWRERVPPDVRERAEERRENDGLKRDIVEYIDFADYVKIIMKGDNWRECFQKIFKSVNIDTKLKELEPIRNSIAHNRNITEEQRKKLEMYAREIINAVSAWI